MCLAVCLAVSLLLAPGCTPSPERPNIVIILADDLGYSDIGAYGGEVRTPHLDALAQNGVRFTQFYNAARCCPTRASLLTGLYPHQAGMGGMVSSLGSEPEPGPYQGYLSDQSVTIAEVLKQAGYRTYMSGKWHVGEKPEHWPRRRGFDRYFGLISGASSYYEIITDQPRVRQMALDDAPWTPPAEGFYMTDAFTDYAVRFLDEHADEHAGEPFFLYLAYTAPHWPLHALPEDIARYQGRYDIGWDSLRAERHARMQAMGLLDARHALSPRPPSVPAWADATDRADWARRMEVYAAMIDRMDQGIGRVIEALEARGLRENTLVLFLSDNGGCAENIEGRNLHDPSVPIGARGSYVAYREPWANASNTPFRRYKQWTHEGGIATPLIAHWPAGLVDPGRIEPHVGHVIDLMATALDLAGVPYPDSLDGRAIRPLQGRSLLPVLRATPAENHEVLYWEHLGNRAVRQGPWKLVWAREVGAWELYRLDEDPTELRDLAERYPEQVQALERLWLDWAEDVGVRLR
ncbi:MAG: arylsulfatase [Bacteroidetes bacterium]|nr:MAG: arylsulfatase [Bacteroidota bacterium]